MIGITHCILGARIRLAMHIYEGVLAGTPHGREVLAAGVVAAVVGTAIGLRTMDFERVPRVAVLSSAFFVVSLLHVRLGPTSEHLMLSGLVGLVLSWAAFPAILVALLLQAMFYGFGGLTTLGLNTCIMTLPAVACYHLFRHAVRARHEAIVFLAGFLAGAVGILLGGMLNAGALVAAGDQFQLFGGVAMVLHLPVAVVEGLVTASVVVLLRKVRPELLNAPLLVAVPKEVLDA